MSSYNFFGATVDDVLRRLSGDLAAASPSLVEAAMGDAEARIEAALPERCRRLLARVEGEEIVRAATLGQLSAPIGLPAASDLVLYADYEGPYADRSPADALDPAAYELDEGGEVVAFSPALSPGTRVVADYDTSLSGGVRVLADLVAELAAAALTRTASFGRPEAVEGLVSRAEARLAALADGGLGVPELDRLRLVEDYERAPRGIRCGELARS